MSNIIDLVENYMINKRFESGAYRGILSTIISRINILLLSFLLVDLIKNQQYLPVLVLIISQFWKLGHWLILLLFGFFIISRYLTGIYVMVFFSILTMISLWSGRAYIKRAILKGRAVIHPLGGMYTMQLYLIIHIILFISALSTSGIISAIFWVLFAFESLHEIHRHWIRLGSPWRKLHFPLSVIYNAIVGHYSISYDTVLRESSLDNSLVTLIETAYPNIDINETASLIESGKKELYNDFVQKPYFDHDITSKSTSNRNVEQEVFESEKTLPNDLAKKYLPIYIIAEIILRDYGEEERSKYLCAYYNGLAF